MRGAGRNRFAPPFRYLIFYAVKDCASIHPSIREEGVDLQCAVAVGERPVEVTFEMAGDRAIMPNPDEARIGRNGKAEIANGMIKFAFCYQCIASFEIGGYGSSECGLRLSDRSEWHRQ